MDGTLFIYAKMETPLDEVRNDPACAALLDWGGLEYVIPEILSGQLLGYDTLDHVLENDDLVNFAENSQFGAEGIFWAGVKIANTIMSDNGVVPHMDWLTNLNINGTEPSDDTDGVPHCVCVTQIRYDPVSKLIQLMVLDHEQ